MDEHIFWARFEDQLIRLDIAKDVYTVLSPGQTSISTRRTKADASGAGASQTSDAWRAPRLRAGRMSFSSVLQFDDHSYPGVSSNCWSISAADASLSVGARMISHALRTLHQVHRISARRRLAGLKEKIESSRCKVGRGKVQQAQIVTAVNAACMLYPKKTKCLEWAAAATLLGHRFGYRGRLVIGIQNRPFYAHAWVEHGGRVLGDDPLLRQKLAVILEIS